MKQTLRLLGLLVFLFALLPASSHAQPAVITSSYFYDSCYNYNSNVLTNVAVGKIETSHGDGQKDTANVYYYNYFTTSTGYTSGYGAETHHSYSSPGTYTIKKVLLANAGFLRTDSVIHSAVVGCAMVTGNIYHDINSNCVPDATEPEILVPVSIAVDSAGVRIDTVMGIGSWSYIIRGYPPTVYKFTMLSTPAGYSFACPASGAISYTVASAGGSIPPQNFGLNCSGSTGFDLQLSMCKALRASTSGGSSYILLYASNSSCTSTNGAIALNVSPKYTINTSGISPAPTTVTGNTVIWTSTGAMAYGTTHSFYVPLTPLSTTINGDTACNYAIITPTSGDLNAANNIISRCDSVNSSWDPNHKSVFPDGNIKAGDVLTYTVQFENLGNDTAYTVRVLDTLAASVDPNSLKVLSSTHPMRTTITEWQAGRVIVKFEFPNIRLADRNHLLTNNGAFTFSVKSLSYLLPGTPITNRAGIYFDGNSAVMTNNAYNKIAIPTGISNLLGASAIKVFPNPVSNALTIQVSGEGWDEALLSNALGQVIIRQTLVRGSNILNLDALPSGIYYLQTKGFTGTTTQKIEKQ